MLKEEYIFFDEDLATKEDALKFISHQAVNLGLTDNEIGLLGDFQKREEEFSTGLQGGFAIPHAKSDYAKKAAILYVSSKHELEGWETLDETAVTHLFALIVPKTSAGEEHLMMISKLATSLLEDEFKDNLKSISDKEQLKEYILKNMEEN